VVSSSGSDSKKPIRSYVIRSGRLTASQRKAIEQFWHDYVIDYRAEMLAVKTLFPTQSELTVEIGFGMGDSLLEMARLNPDKNFIGIEVHRPGIGKILHGIVQYGLTNLKLICHDASEVLANCFESESIDRILILFPDPWPKKRHNKRRLVQAEFTSLLVDKLRPGALLHLATDWEAYAKQMMEVAETTPGLTNKNGVGHYWETPARPQTKFEERGKRLGHDVWDLLFTKTAGSTGSHEAP
jgi:tRNA (guanine-N7-)-methyltransferase